MTRKIDDPWEISQDSLPRTLDGAIDFLKIKLSEQIEENDEGLKKPLIEELTRMINQNPEKWWVEHHFIWGMGIRNLLRKNGFGEQELGVDNLDDYYVGLIEQACLGKGNNHHKMP